MAAGKCLRFRKIAYICNADYDLNVLREGKLSCKYNRVFFDRMNALFFVSVWPLDRLGD